jgi:hypothetical protein
MKAAKDEHGNPCQAPRHAGDRRSRAYAPRGFLHGPGFGSSAAIYGSAKTSVSKAAKSLGFGTLFVCMRVRSDYGMHGRRNALDDLAFIVVPAELSHLPKGGASWATISRDTGFGKGTAQRALIVK